MIQTDRRRSVCLLISILILAFLVSPSHLPALDAEEPPYSFVVIGHLRGEPDAGLYFLIDELIDRVSQTQPDMVFLTGDMIFGDWHRPVVDRERIIAQWEELDRALGRLEVPVYRVPGNHDINDPVTRDVYYGRYGKPPQSVTFGRDLFLLVASPHIPLDDSPVGVPRPHSRVRELSHEQVDFIRAQLEEGHSFNNIFVFMHHIVWWSPDAPWWQQVHPILVESGGRAVFAGDHGPLKFSHLRRDGIDYLHTALEGRVPADWLRPSEEGRLIHYQFDHFLNVTVSGRDVRVELEVIGAQSSGKFSPDFYREVFLGIQRALREMYGCVAPYFGSVPLYAAGNMSWTIAGDDVVPTSIRPERLACLDQSCRYYTAEIHRAAFAQPAWIRRALETGTRGPAADR